MRCSLLAKALLQNSQMKDLLSAPELVLPPPGALTSFLMTAAAWLRASPWASLFALPGGAGATLAIWTGILDDSLYDSLYDSLVTAYLFPSASRSHMVCG